MYRPAEQFHRDGFAGLQDNGKLLLPCREGF
jgi:hypothetical protein